MLRLSLIILASLATAWCSYQDAEWSNGNLAESIGETVGMALVFFGMAWFIQYIIRK